MNSQTKKSGVFWRWTAFLALTAIVAVGAFSLGAPVSFFDLWSQDATRAEIARRIFWREGGEWGLRPVRLAAGVLVGASLACAGTALQSVFRNPLAEPYLLGTSAGGALGAAVGMTLHGGAAQVGGFDSVSLLAFIGSLAATALVYVLGRGASTRGPFGRGALLLTGVAVSSFLSALMALVVALSGRLELAQQLTFWMLGGLTRATTSHNIAMSVALLLGLLLLLGSARDLNALRAGDDEAATLGVPVEKLHVRLMLAAALLCAASVAAAGLIGFIGLMAPHMARRVFGLDARVLIPASAIGGGVLLLACDGVARSVARPVELPVGIITALLGVPLFLALARGNAK